MSSSETSPPKQFHHVIAGAGAGCLTAIATCPLDVLKTRLQNEQTRTDRSTRRSISASLRWIWTQEGLRGLYRGLGPTVLGYLPTWAVYFGTYDRYKSMASTYYHLPAESTIVHVTGAVGAGITSTLVTNPLWVIKTRMMTQSATTALRYRNTLDAFRTTLRLDGVKGFYKGLAPSLFGVTHVAVQFPLYEHLKAWKGIEILLGKSADLPPSQLTLLMASTTSKLCASVLTYPHEVIRTRLHNESTPPKKYLNLMQAIQTVLKEEGWRGMYKGFATNLVRTVPASAVTLLSYEALIKLLADVG